MGLDFAAFYSNFDAPISALDCGERCAPYNEGGIPFCCDTRHAVPTAYVQEWEYLQAHTGLWHLWNPTDKRQAEALQKQTPRGQVLIECLGWKHCERQYRAVTCRAFPFFPYLDRAGRFLGLAYYWEYEDRCWVISNLQVVSEQYRQQFIRAFETLFAAMPEERESFRYHAMIMRRVFGRWHRAILLLHRNGGYYKVTPSNGRMRRISAQCLPKFGPYALAAALPFADETELPVHG